MADDYWGEGEREVFEATMARVFPDRPIVEIAATIRCCTWCSASTNSRRSRAYRRLGGDLDRLPSPHWRGIYDDRGRLMVGINHNQDVGDSWEEADTPDYPEPMTALGYRLGINYIVYAMTHHAIPRKGALMVAPVKKTSNDLALSERTSQPSAR